MAIVHVGNLGTAFSSGNNQASLALTTSAAAAAGSLVVVIVAVDNIQTASGDAVSPQVASVQNDGAANTWIRAKEWVISAGAAQDGADCAIFYSVLTNALASGAIITATFTTASLADASAMTARNFSLGAGNRVGVVGSTGAHGTSLASLDVTTANIEHLRVRGIASETHVTTALTPTASWTIFTSITSAATGGITEMGVRGEFRIVTATNAASAPTGGAGTVDHASAYVAFKELAPQIVAVGQASGTNTAQAITKRRAVQVGQASETDTATAVDPIAVQEPTVGFFTALWLYASTPAISFIIGVGQATDSSAAFGVNKTKSLDPPSNETDTATAIAKRKLRTTGQALETDTATVIAKRKVLAVGQASETDTATAVTLPTGGPTVGFLSLLFPLGGLPSAGQNVAVGQAISTNTAFNIAKRRTIFQALEADSATAIAKRKLKAVVQALETDTAQAVAKRKARTLTQAVETDTAQSFGTTVTVSLGLATSTPQTAQPIAKIIKVKSVGQASSANTAQAITRVRTKAVGLATSTPQTAFAIARRKSKAVGQATSLNTAQPLGSVIAAVVGQALSANTAQAITRRKSKAIGQAASTNTAFGVHKRRVLFQVTSANTAQAITRRKSKAIGLATSTPHTAFAIAKRKSRMLGLAVEIDISLPIGLISEFGGFLRRVDRTERPDRYNEIHRPRCMPAVQQQLRTARPSLRRVCGR